MHVIYGQFVLAYGHYKESYEVFIIVCWKPIFHVLKQPNEILSPHIGVDLLRYLYRRWLRTV